MASRIRKLTAVGLPARDELLVRSLLQVVSTKTTEAWMFQENLEADVALCNPASALAAVAMRRASSHGLLCASVVHEETPSLPDTLTLRAPIRSADFIDLLNHASEQLIVPLRVRRSAGGDSACSGPAALAMRELLLKGGARYASISVGEASFVIALTTRRIGGAIPQGEAELLQLGLGEARLERLEDATGEQRMAAARWVDSLDRLLWLAGLHASEAALHDGLPVDGCYRLRRWPDAGRLPLQPFHLRMASLLVRQAMSAAELAELTGQPLAQARAFLQACAMCCLLDEHAANADAPAAVPVTPPRRSRYGELFQSIRAVLGIRS